MAKADKKQIDIPASATSKKLDEDFIIHVMPKEFKGRTADVKKLPLAAKPIPPPVKIMPKPVPVKKPVDTKKKGRRSTLILILVGVIIVLLFLVAALFVLRSLQDETIVEVPVEVPVEQDTDSVDEPVEEIVRQGVDTDSDGLTDVEEELYGTDFRNPDTDADSFLDGNEVFHRYDPIGYAPSTLLDTGSVEIYESVEEDGYSVYYPRSWRVQESFDQGTGMTSEVEFVARTRSTISILAFAKDEGATFEEWFEESGEGRFASLLNIISKEGYPGYISQDKFTAYLDTEDTVYLFIYDLKNEKSIEYLQTFQMMVNSFILP